MPKSGLEFHPLLRIAGLHNTALEALDEALREGKLPIHGDLSGLDIHAPDLSQIDPNLHVEVISGADSGEPHTGTSYSGLTPAQRGHFIVWADSVTGPTYPAYQRLFIAHVEVDLLDLAQSSQFLRRHMIQWSVTPAWRQNEWLSRAILLALWLDQNGDGIATWSAAIDIPREILELCLSLQMQLDEPLRAEQLGKLATAWGVPGANNAPDVLAMRLATLEESLGEAPLAYLRKQLSASELQPRPWRTAHRALRFGIPQPPIRPHLEPLLQDALGLAADLGVHQVEEVAGAQKTANPEWQLILEFGQSRSEFYDHVLELAQRMPGYLQLMDEDRRIVHRIIVHKREMRRFWRIWEFVQNWSATHVYMNGEELEPWKVWPYSQYLR